MEKELKNRIIGVITYYRLQGNEDKTPLLKLLSNEIGVSESSVYYKLANSNFNKAEVKTAEEVILKHFTENPDLEASKNPAIKKIISSLQKLQSNV